MADSPFRRWAPATWLSLACLVLAILLWPRLLGQVVSLNWKICDMGPVALGSQLLMAVMAIVILAGRQPSVRRPNRTVGD